DAVGKVEVLADRSHESPSPERFENIAATNRSGAGRPDLTRKRKKTESCGVSGVRRCCPFQGLSWPQRRRDVCWLKGTRCSRKGGEMSEVTQILDAIPQGDQKAAAELLPLVYDELRRLAASKLAREAPGQTLQPTALVHEAYLRLVGTADERRWNSRG